MYIIILLAVLTILSGICGRLGGAGKPGKWYDFLCKSWIRDWVIPLWIFIGLGFLGLLQLKFWWLYLITYVIIGGSFSTYYDSIFGYDNFWFSGLGNGFALFPMIWAGISWYSILIRTVVLCLIWGGLHEIKSKKILLWNKAVGEEILRYASVIPTLLVLLI